MSSHGSGMGKTTYEVGSIVPFELGYNVNIKISLYMDGVPDPIVSERMIFVSAEWIAYIKNTVLA